MRRSPLSRLPLPWGARLEASPKNPGIGVRLQTTDCPLADSGPRNLFLRFFTEAAARQSKEPPAVDKLYVTVLATGIYLYTGTETANESTYHRVIVDLLRVLDDASLN